MPRTAALILSVCLLAAAAPALRADEWQLARCLPAGRLGLLRVDDGAGLAARLPRLLFDLWEPDGKLASELRRYRAEGGPGAAQLFSVVLDGRFELALYERGRERLRDNAAGSTELLLVAEPREPALAREQLEHWAADAAAHAQPVSRGSYRGHAYLRLGRALVATSLGERLALATDDDLLADAIDRSLDGDSQNLPAAPPPGGASLGLSPSLARRPQLQAAALLRRGLGIPAAAVAQLVLGPLEAALESEQWIEGTLSPRRGGLAFELTLPGSASMARSCWFPEDSSPAAWPVRDGSLATLSLSRDLADWWRQRERLLPEEDQPRLARLDEDASAMLGGASLAEDLLARLGTTLCLAIDRDPDSGRPAACLIATLGDEPFPRDTLSVAFQSAIGALNLLRGVTGQATFLLETEVHRGARLLTCRSVTPLNAAERQPADGPADVATPTLALLDDRLLLGTSAGQVRALVDAFLDGHISPAEGPEHLALAVDCAALAALGRDLRPSLVARALLERGLVPDEAGETVDRWLASLAGIGQLHLGLAPRHADLVLTLTSGPTAAEVVER